MKLREQKQSMRCSSRTRRGSVSRLLLVRPRARSEAKFGYKTPIDRACVRVRDPSPSRTTRFLSIAQVLKSDMVCSARVLHEKHRSE